MNVEQFSKLHTISQKINKLKQMTSDEKKVLLEEQEHLIRETWKRFNYKVSAKLREIKEFNNINNTIIANDYELSFIDWTSLKYEYPSKTQKSIYQWDIFYCDLGQNIGGEKNKTRPVLIVQKTMGYLNADTIMVAPITIGDGFEKLYKHEILIDATKWNKVKGKVDLSHIRAIDKKRLDEKCKDKLLTDEEYRKLPNCEKKISTVEKIKFGIKMIFSIDV